MTQWELSSVQVQMITTVRHNAFALLILPIFTFIGFIGNLLVVVAICTDKRLQNVTNYFLLSLAIADLLVCCIVMPISIIVEVRHGLWTWNIAWCLAYVYCDVFLCSASIVHMSVISLDRYLGISAPLRRNKSKTMIVVKIAGVWMITFMVSLPIGLLGIKNNSNVLRDNLCMIYHQEYIIYGSTLTFLIPFCIMAVTYVLTTNLLNRQASILSQCASDKLNGNGLRRTMAHRKLGYSRTNSTLTNGIGHKASTTSGDRAGYKASVVSYKEDADLSNLLTTNNNVALSVHRPLSKSSSAMTRFKNRTSSYIGFIANRVSRRNSIQTASQELANEHKATRVLAVVFICFFICWTPFFAANFITGFCGEICALPSWMGSLFLWLGYISSTVNPIIYTVFNKRFRQAFVRILRCQCWHPMRYNQSGYSRNFTTICPDTYTWSNNDRGLSMNGREDGNGSVRNSKDTHGWRARQSDEHEKKTSTQSASPKFATRDSRGTTEENSDEELLNEQRPLISSHPTVTSTSMRKSLTTLLTPPIYTIPKSNSCIECTNCNAMIESTDTETTMSSSITTCPKHLTLFSSTFGPGMKETFL